MSRGYACIGLYNPKNSANVGAALRAAHCLWADMVAIQGRRFQRVPTDTTKAWRHMPLIQTNDLRSIIPYACVPVAVEIVPGAYDLAIYHHPERAFYVFGPEDGSIPASALAWCREVVQIPTRYCLNLGATVNVVLYDRAAKQARSEP